MNSKFNPAETSLKGWNKDPKYVAEYAALEAEFAPGIRLDRGQR